MSVNRSSVISSLIWKFMERCCVQGVSFIVTIVLARILCPEDYGLIALVAVFLSLSNVIVEGGLNSALIQKKNANEVDFSTIFYTSIALSSLLYAALFVGAPSIASFYHIIELTPVVRVLGTSLFFYAINSVQKAYLSRNLLFKNLFYSSLGAVLLSGIVGILMAYNGFGVWALVAQSIISQVATTIIMWFTVKWRPILVFSKQSFLELFGFGWKIFISNLVISLFTNARSLIIGKVYNASSLAYFDRGKQFPSLIMDNINGSIQSVLFPVLSQEQDNESNVRAIVRRTIKTSSYIISPIVIGLAITAEPVVRCLLTDKWIDAVPFIQIFCIAFLLMPLQIANLEAIKSLGHSGTTLKLELSKKVIELIVLLVTVPISVKAIACGIVVYNAICIFINTIPNKKLLNYGVLDQIKDVLPAFFVTSCMGIPLILVNHLITNPYANIGVNLLVGATLYILLSYIFRLESFYYFISVMKKK